MPNAHAEHAVGPEFVIVGPLRAGTTMLRLMLNNHPQIGVVGEFEEAVAPLGDSGFPSPQHYRDWLASHRVAQSRCYDLPETLADYPSMVNAMWSQLAKKHADTQVVGCTIHSRIDRVLDLWPDTRLICLVRDPRDVCRSCVGMGWFGHPADATRNWIDPIERWERARDRNADDRSVLIRYEDLLTDPLTALSQCTSLLGLGYDPQMLSFHESSSYEQLDPKLAEQWRTKMSPRCAEIIDARCVPKMQSYGYAPSTPEPRDADAFEKIAISIKSKLGRFDWRRRRYGLGLVLKWAIAKRLPITNAWRLGVRIRMNEIDRAHLR